MKWFLKCLATVVAAMLVMGAAAAAYAVRSGGAAVTSSAELVITGNSSSSLDNAYTASQYVTSRMSTYAAVATSETVLRPASSSLGVNEDGLIGAVTATVVPNTTVLDLSVKGSTPVEAQRRAKAVSVSISRAITDLETGTISPASAVAVKVLSSASKPSISTLPSPANSGLIGAGLGLVLGFIFCVIVGTLGSWRGAKLLSPVRDQDPAEPYTGAVREEENPQRLENNSPGEDIDRSSGASSTSTEASPPGGEAKAPKWIPWKSKGG